MLLYYISYCNVLKDTAENKIKFENKGILFDSFSYLFNMLKQDYIIRKKHEVSI